MSLAYRVEELLALRDSVSESAVSIDKFADEDVIKEHVLRPSASANAISATSSDKALPPAAAFRPGLSPAIVNIKKPSPSPSIKRGKAERLLKEHGSPPGMRVTAGGRVVPSDLPPLNSVRFGSNNFRPPVLRVVDPGNAMSAQSQQAVNATTDLPQIQLIGTQAVIRVGDRMFALPTYNPNYSVPATLPTEIESTKSSLEPIKMAGTEATAAAAYAGQRSSTQSPFTGPDLATLEAQWNQKKEELRFVEQTEVLQADHQGPAWRSQVIAKKKSLILEIDGLRKQVTAAKDAAASKIKNVSPPAIPLPASAVPAPLGPGAFMPQYPTQMPPVMLQGLNAPLAVQSQTAYPPMMMYPPFQGQAFPSDGATFGQENPLFVSGDGVVNGVQLPKTYAQSTNVPHSPPGSGGRRSHAVPIKKPREEAKKPATQGSSLDPKSPTYEPVVKANGKIDNQSDMVPPTPSPAKRSPWRLHDFGSSQSKQSERVISQKPSLSSIDTTDFFPTNTHEHSSTRIAPNKLSKHTSRENELAPSTPEKPWQFGPWNPPSDGVANRAGLGSQQDQLKLTSWPEAFGKQTSAHTNSKTTAEAGTSSTLLRKSSTQNTGSELNWPPISQKPVNYSPSTYQEGYQAGLRHLGLPNMVEVLHGFADGLAAYLKELSLKEINRNGSWATSGSAEHLHRSSAHSSLRAHLSGATLHDSAVSLSENTRSAKVNTQSRLEQPLSANVNALNAQVLYELRNDVKLEPRKTAPLQQGKTDQDRAESIHGKAIFGREFSGNQLQGRMSAKPASMQRYFPAIKEFAPGMATDDKHVTLSRPAPRNRLSGLDGAMDDLAGIAIESRDDKTSEGNEPEASCFKSSSNKGKQKMPVSPTKSSNAGVQEASSPDRAPSSPRKSGESSPTKAKLEHVTNKLLPGRQKKDDPRTMAPEEKAEHRRKWRSRFQNIRRAERQAIEQYRSEHPRNQH